MKTSRCRTLLPVLAAAALLFTACEREPTPAGGAAPSVVTPGARGPSDSAGDRGAFLLSRATRFLADGESGEALKVLELARQADPSSARIAVELGRAYLAGKRFKEAQKILEEVLAAPGAGSAEKVRGRELLVEVLLSQGETDRAEQACAPLLQGDGVTADARRLSGMIAYRKGDPESMKRAVSELKEAVRLAPSDAEALTALGLALLQVGDPGGAASALEEAVKQDPNSESAMSNLEKVYRKQGRVAEAESAHKRFQEIYDRKSVRQKVGPIRAKGVEAFNAGRLEEALESFREILKMSPRDSQALAHAGSVSLAMQRLDQAEDYLKQALEVRPEDDFALTEMGRVRALRNDLPGAIDLLQRAARSNPQAPEPHYFLAGIFYAQQRKEDFLREKATFERLRMTSPVPGVMELPEAPGP